MRVLFYCDECIDFWDLLPVMKMFGQEREMGFCSIDPRPVALAEKHGLPLTASPLEYDLLVVGRMHYSYSRALSEVFYRDGKPIVLIEHATDGIVHLADSFMGYPINFFTVMAVSGPRQFDLLKRKFPGKLKITGMPKLDKLAEAANWDKQPIYDLLGTDDFMLVTIPVENEYYPEVEEKFFIELPKLLKCTPIYKIHPRYPVDRYLRYGQKVIGDDTLTNDITYELLNASQGIVTAGSFMTVEASILRKPVIMYCEDYVMSPEQIVAELAVFNAVPKEFDSARLSSSFENPLFNHYQEELIQNYLHDGRNTERVVKSIEEIIDGVRRPKKAETIKRKKEKLTRKVKKKSKKAQRKRHR